MTEISATPQPGNPATVITIPNILTLLRLLLIPVFLVASFHGAFLIACIVFVSAMVTDILDGMIARRFNQRSRLGAILDPAADKGLMIAAYLYYTLASNLPLVRIPAWLTLVVFVRDFLIIVFAYLLYTRVQVTRFPPSVAGKVSTVLQAFSMATAIAVNSFAPGLLGMAELLFRFALVMTLFSAWDYLRRANRMLLESAAA